MKKEIESGSFFRQIILDARHHSHDLIALCVLLSFSATVFVPFRIVPVPNVLWGFIYSFVCMGFICGWLFWSRFPVITKESQLPGLWDWVAIAALVGITVGIYYPLALIHFDTGTDLSVAFGVDEIWFKPWASINRPLVGVGPYIALMLTPDSLGGFFVVICTSRFATGVLVYLTIRLFTPHRYDIALSAGILYIVNPAELSRFNLWSIYYQVALFSLSLASYLFLLSYRYGSRTLLLLACSLLGFTFLQYEHGYPLAAALPFCLFFWPRRSYLILWMTAWYGSMAIFAVRLVTYLIFQPSTYQLELYTSWVKGPETMAQWVDMIFHNILIQLAPVLKMVTSVTYLHRYPIEAMIVLGTIVVVVWGILSRCGMSVQSKRPWVFLVGGVVATTLGVAIYFPLPITSLVPDYSDYPTMRYQYFAGLGHAIFWSSIIAILASFVRSPKRRIIVTAFLVAFLSSAAVTKSISYQESGGVLNSHYTYKVAARVLTQISQNLPHILPGDGIFLEIPDSDRSPIGWDYTGFHWSCVLFGIPMSQGRIDENGEFMTRVFSSSAELHSPGPRCNRMHLFSVDELGNVRFTETREMRSSPDLKCNPCVLNQHSRSTGATLPFVTEPITPNFSQD